MQASSFFSHLMGTYISDSPTHPKSCLSRRELTTVFKHNDTSIHVSCTYSICRTKCIFSSTEFGDILFHRKHKVLLSSALPADDRYIKFLERTLDQWEKYFDDFDLRPYIQSWEETKK